MTIGGHGDVRDAKFVELAEEGFETVANERLPAGDAHFLNAEMGENARESFELLRVLCNRRQLTLQEEDYQSVEGALPLLLTPGSAETLAVKIYRISRTENKSPGEALRASLRDYQNPVPLDALQFQISLAVQEASDLEFVPSVFRGGKA